MNGRSSSESVRLHITLRDVAVRRGGKWVLRDLGLELRAGERWALVGGNGAGKTQLLKLLATDVWPTPTGREQLVYRLGRGRIDCLQAKRRVVYLGAERQDKYSRYGWNLTVGDLIATGLHGTDLLLAPITPAQRRRVESIMSECGLTQFAQRRFLTLSYGLKRLALLARALVRRPSWLFLDEFYNGLDPRYRARVDAILDARTAVGQSWVVAAHRAADVPRGATHLMELEAGRLRTVKRFEPDDARRLARLAEEPRPITTGIRTRTPRLPAAGAAAPLGARPPATRPAPECAPQPLLRLAGCDLYVEYRLVLRDVHWDLRAGEHWAVFGANGAGKSSFLRLIYGDLSPALGGRIERSGFPPGTPIAAWKRRVGFVSPELQTDYGIDVSVHDLVASGRHASIGLADPPTAADRRAASRWLTFFDLEAAARRRPRELSYGQLRRALIARALAANPRLLLLDEPLTGLDPLQRAAIKRFLERLMMRGVTLIIAVHHAEDLPRGVSHAIRLHKRRAILLNYDTAN